MKKNNHYRLATTLLHHGEPENGVMNAVSMPIFQSSTYHTQGNDNYHDLKYLRLNNSPNHEVLHSKLSALEGTESALVTSSGMAAISTTLLSLLKPGDHILAQSGTYGGTYTFITHTLQKFNIAVDFIDLSDPDSWIAFLRSNTRLIYAESITNPMNLVGELAAVTEFAMNNGLISVIDNTLASPVNFRPHDIGFDLVLHSATKYLNGHSDIVAGVVAGSKDQVEEIRINLNHYGGTLDPHACFLLHRGLKTLSLRVGQQNQNGLGMARFLEAHTSVSKVHYAGLESHPDHQRATHYLRGFGGLLSFELAGDLEQAKRVIDKLELAAQAPSLGGVESLIGIPAISSHAGLNATERAMMGIKDNLIRVAVGIEDLEDLKEDFSQALSL